MNYEICVIGSKGFVFPFMQFGFATYIPSDEDQLRNLLEDKVLTSYGIIYIEDSLCSMIHDIIQEYRYSTHPIIVPLGGASSDSYGRKVAREMMEKAIGMNILK